MSNFIRVPFAVEGEQTEIPLALQTDGHVSMQTGYTFDYERDPAVDTQAKDVERDKMNWLFGLLTTVLRQYQSEGTYPYITPEDNGGTPFPYPKYARCLYADQKVSGVFESLVDNNTSAPADAAKWQNISAGKYVSSARTITTTAPLTGGGVLDKDLTIAMPNPLPMTNGGTGNSAGLAAAATKLATARTIRTNLAGTSAASFDGSANITPGVSGTLPIANGGTGNTTGLAASATKLAAARTVQTNLASATAASFDGSANIAPGVTGVLPVANGGTGNNTGNAASATKLATARTVQTNLGSTAAASFNGTANIAPGVSGVLPVASGGTGATSVADIIKMLYTPGGSQPTPGNLLSFGSSGANSGYTTPLQLRNTMGLGNTTGALPIANGGTGNTTGNAATATKLQTSRNVHVNLGSSAHAPFDGTAGLTPGVYGVLPIANGGTGNTTGNAASATKLATARNITLTGDVTGTVSFNGTANAGIAATWTAKPKWTAGLGQVAFIQDRNSVNTKIPAGGTWLCSILSFAPGSGALYNNLSGLWPGGSTVKTEGAATADYIGFAWRIA